jgi:transposase
MHGRLCWLSVLDFCFSRSDFAPCRDGVATSPSMRDFGPGLKHQILSQYQAGVRGSGFDALAARYGVPGGGRTVQRWHTVWDGTPASLIAKKSPGRPRKLSRTLIYRHIVEPVRRANDAHRAIHFRTLHSRLQAATGVQCTLRTVQRAGHNVAKIKQQRTKKRTQEERE